MNVINQEKLIALRGERSRAEVASAIGVTRQQIWNYETGASEPPLSVLGKLADFYNVQLPDLLNEKNLATTSN